MRALRLLSCFRHSPVLITIGVSPVVCFSGSFGGTFSLTPYRGAKCFALRAEGNGAGTAGICLRRRAPVSGASLRSGMQESAGEIFSISKRSGCVLPGESWIFWNHVRVRAAICRVLCSRPCWRWWPGSRCMAMSSPGVWRRQDCSGNMLPTSRVFIACSGVWKRTAFWK